VIQVLGFVMLREDRDEEDDRLADRVDGIELQEVKKEKMRTLPVRVIDKIGNN
jgi:hypothetical protein